MGRKVYKTMLVGLMAVLLVSVFFQQRQLNRSREQLGLTRLKPLDNAPPVLAFTTVATKGKLSQTIIGSVVIIYLGIFISCDELSPFTWLATAGNSLLGVRSAFPLITFAVWLSDLRLVRKAMLSGTGLALTLCCGTEHGLAMLLIVFGVGLPTMGIRYWRGQATEDRIELESPLFYALTFVSFIVSLFAIYLTLSTPAGMSAALRYNLISVPADQ